MRSVSLALTLTACMLLALGTSSVKSQVLETMIVSYYECMENVTNSTVLHDSNDFYNTTLLQGITTTTAAMAYIRSLFLSVATCPTNNTAFCECMARLVFNTPIGQQNLLMNYVWFFTDDVRFAELTQILNDFRTAYPTQLTIAQIWSPSTLNPYLASLPALVSFVLKYDCTPNILEYYNVTASFMNSITADKSRQCFQTYLTTNQSMMSSITPAVFKPDALMRYAQCLIRLVAGLSDTTVKRLFGVGFVALFPDIVGTTDLIQYIDSLYTTSLPNPRRSVWIAGDPHIFSLNKRYEICNFQGLTHALYTPFYDVWCIASAPFAGQVVTVMTDVNVTFTNGALSVLFTASNNTLPDKLSITISGITITSTILPDTSGNTWLQISSPSTNKRTILDYKSNSTFFFTRSTISAGINIYTMIIKTRIQTLADSTATGLLISGCAAGDLDPSSPVGLVRRRKRTPTACANVGTTATTTEETMPPAIVQSMCDTDVTKSGDNTFATIAADTVDSMKTLLSADSTFPTNQAGRLLNKSMFNSLALLIVTVFIYTRF